MTGCSWLSGHAPHYPGTAYVLLHSLSHSLMAEIALDCGYPELAERACVSAIRPTVPPNAAGLSFIPQLPAPQGHAWRSGRNGAKICVNPRGRIGNGQGSARMMRFVPIINRTTAVAIRATHGAARHGRLLIAETSCEMRNLFLDRNLLVPTMGPDGSAFFRISRIAT